MASDSHPCLTSATQTRHRVVPVFSGVIVGIGLAVAGWSYWPRGEAAPAATAKPQAAAEEERVAADDLRAQLAVLLLTGLQAPGGQPAGATAPDEAGAEFWKAAKAARTGDFKAAIEALDKAKTLHNQRRFARLKQAQNPESDPLEEIFLRTCDEIKEYWQ